MTSSRAPADDSKRRTFAALGVLLAAAAAPRTALPATPSTSQPVAKADSAEAATRAWLDLLEKADIPALDALIEPDLLGRSQLIQQLRDLTLAEKQIRLHMRDVRMAPGEVTAVTFGWERRALTFPGSKAVMKTGTAAFYWRRGAEGWRLVGIAGDDFLRPAR
jgi:ketosteroid isomerase-like protein